LTKSKEKIEAAALKTQKPKIIVEVVSKTEEERPGARLTRCHKVLTDRRCRRRRGTRQYIN
jgi:hypothetical protein